MYTAPDHTLKEFFIASGRAPETVTKELTAAIKKHKSAYKITSDALNDIDLAARALDETERTVIDELAAWTNNKTSSIDAALIKLATAQNKLDHAKEVHRLAQHIERRTLSNIGGIWNRCRLDRLIWVAKYRADNIHAVGINAVPLEAREMYKELAIIWSARIDPTLELGIFKINNGDSLRIPLVWSHDLTIDERASLAWWWTEVAAGEIRLPSDIKDADRPRLKRQVNELPSVPAAPIGFVPASRLPPQW